VVNPRSGNGKFKGHTMEYAVKGETPKGEITIVKRGFGSQEEAEDHPIRMSDWKRVWVELIQPSNDDQAGRK
jgi:hypothetical protein